MKKLTLLIVISLLFPLSLIADDPDEKRGYGEDQSLGDMFDEHQGGRIDPSQIKGEVRLGGLVQDQEQDERDYQEVLKKIDAAHKKLREEREKFRKEKQAFEDKKKRPRPEKKVGEAKKKTPCEEMGCFCSKKGISPACYKKPYNCCDGEAPDKEETGLSLDLRGCKKVGDAFKCPSGTYKKVGDDPNGLGALDELYYGSLKDDMPRDTASDDGGETNPVGGEVRDK